MHIGLCEHLEEWGFPWIPIRPCRAGWGIYIHGFGCVKNDNCDKKGRPLRCHCAGTTTLCPPSPSPFPVAPLVTSITVVC